jgi:tetratricopeptide (TPR) repeat protein
MAQINREALIQSAEKNVARGKLDVAIKEYERVLEDAPRDASTLNRIGDLWLRLNKVEEAKRVFARTAYVYIEDGFLVKAIAMYKKIIKCDPTGIDAYERLADLYHRQGLVNEARTQYQVLADYHYKHSNSTAAAAMLERLVELEPDSPGHRARLAELYQQMGAIDRSLAERRSIADLLLERAHEDEAVKVLMTAYALRTDDLEFVADTVQSLRARGFVGPAARFLAQVVDKNPTAHDFVIRRLGSAAMAAAAPAPAAPAAPPAAAPPSSPSSPMAQAASAPASLLGPSHASNQAPPAEIAARFAESAPALETGTFASPSAPPAPAAPAKPKLRVEGDPNPPLPKATRAVTAPTHMPNIPGWSGELPPPDVTFSFDALPSLEPERVTPIAPTAPATPAPVAAAPAPVTPPAASAAEVPAPSSSGFDELEIEIEIEGHSEPDGTDWRDLSAAADVQDVASVPEMPAPILETPRPAAKRTPEVARAPEPAPAASSTRPVEPPAATGVSSTGFGTILDDPSAVPAIDFGKVAGAADEIAAAAAKAPRVEELIAEAEVLAKYGLVGRALERLREIVRNDPGQVDAYRAMIGIHFEQGRRDRVAEVATQWLVHFGGSPPGSAWRETRDRLESEGFRIDGRSIHPPGADGGRADRGRASVDSLLRGLVPGKPEAEKKAATPASTPAAQPAAPAPPAPVTPTPAKASKRPVVEPEPTPQFEPVDPPVAVPIARPAAAPAAPAAAAPAASAAPKKKKLSIEDLELGNLAPKRPAASAAPSASPATPTASGKSAPPRETSKVKSSGAVREDSFAELEFEEAPPTEVKPPTAPAVARRAAEAATRSTGELFEAATPAFEVDPPPVAAEAAPASPAPQIIVPSAPEPPTAHLATSKSLPSRTSEPLHTADWLDLGDLAAPWTEIPEVAARTEPAPVASSELLSPLPPLDSDLPPPVLRSTAQDLFEDSAVSWLEPAPTPGKAEEQLFDDEGEFFDLAAELEKELQTENARRGAAAVEPEIKEQSLEEIVESFKKGVAENLPAEDYDTHFNLGIAYREMGLLDEAIGEFQLAAKAPEHFLDCCSLLGLCFLDKGLPELAVKWYRRALDSPGLSEEQQLAVQYELGNALAAAGERDAAYKTFVDIYGSNSHFRDVVVRIAELKAR